MKLLCVFFRTMIQNEWNTRNNDKNAATSSIKKSQRSTISLFHCTKNQDDLEKGLSGSRHIFFRTKKLMNTRDFEIFQITIWNQILASSVAFCRKKDFFCSKWRMPRIFKNHTVSFVYKLITIVQILIQNFLYMEEYGLKYISVTWSQQMYLCCTWSVKNL